MPQNLENEFPYCKGQVNRSYGGFMIQNGTAEKGLNEQRRFLKPKVAYRLESKVGPNEGKSAKKNVRVTFRPWTNFRFMT